MAMRLRLLIGLALALAVTACDGSGSTPQQPCVDDGDCRDGVNGHCVPYTADLVTTNECVYDQCATNAQCPEGRVCSTLTGDDSTEDNLGLRAIAELQEESP